MVLPGHKAALMNMFIITDVRCVAHSDKYTADYHPTLLGVLASFRSVFCVFFSTVTLL